MDWKPNRADKKPIYKQIADYIEQGISSGLFSPDSVLPSERALANELQVNRSTVVAAYEELMNWLIKIPMNWMVIFFYGFINIKYDI